MSTIIYLIVSFFHNFSPSKSTKFLTTPSPDEAPKGGAIPRDPQKSPKKGFLPQNRDGGSGKSDRRQTLDKNIKQLFGKSMASKGKTLNIRNKPKNFGSKNERESNNFQTNDLDDID